MAQKARREVEEKTWKKAKRQRVVEEKERKRRTMEYLQQLWDKVLEEEAALLEGAGEDMIIQKQEQKTSFFIYVLLT